MPTPESDTPRTDDFLKSLRSKNWKDKSPQEHLCDFARTLEQELNAANQLCVDQNNNLILQQQQIDKLEQANQLLEARCAVYEDSLKLIRDVLPSGWAFHIENGLSTSECADRVLSQSIKLGEELLADRITLDWLQNNYHNIQFPHKSNGNKFRIFCINDGVFEGDTLRQAIKSAILVQQQSTKKDK